MMLGLPLSTVIELILAALLAPTLYCCFLLERRLKNLRKDQEDLKSTVQALNAGVIAAQASLAGLRAAAAEADKTLGVKVATARLLSDELSVLTASGERIASRMESARETQKILRGIPPATADGLRAVR